MVSGVNIGSLSNNQTKTLTYQAQTASAQNFAFGTTTLTNLVSAVDGYNVYATGNAQVVVTRSGVLGATTVSTGPLTGNFLVDSFLLPLILALAGVWAWKSGMLNNLAIAGWINKKKTQASQSTLQNKISAIREKESA